MLRDDAKKIAAEIEERINTGSTAPGVTATVQADQMTPQVTAAGAGRPIFINYYIRIADSTRMATLHLGQATGLLGEIEPGWDADRLFDAIRAREVPIEDNIAEGGTAEGS